MDGANAAIPPTVTVVIPARNAAKTLGLQLTSLAEQVYGDPWEIVVVDNDSSDGTAEIVASRLQRMPNLRLVTCEHVGANHARNAGLRVAQADRFLLCDADDSVDRLWVRNMVSALDAYDLVGGRVDYERLNFAPLRIGRDQPAVADLPLAFSIQYGIGANLGFRRGVFEALDGFDEAFQRGADEIDFCLRAQYAGFTIGFAREAVVHYRLREDLLGLARQQLFYAQGGALLRRKHTDLGRLKRQNSKGLAMTTLRRLRPLLRVWRLFDRSGRRDYLGRAGWFLGSV